LEFPIRDSENLPRNIFCCLFLSPFSSSDLRSIALNSGIYVSVSRVCRADLSWKFLKIKILFLLQTESPRFVVKEIKMDLRFEGLVEGPLSYLLNASSCSSS